MKKNNWKRTIAGLLAMTTLFSLSLSATSVFAENTAAEVSTVTEVTEDTTTKATNVVEIQETDMPLLSEGETTDGTETGETGGNTTEEELAPEDIFEFKRKTVTIDGVEQKVATITGYLGTEADLVIPDTLKNAPVVEIDANVFYGNTDLESVTMPDTITIIGADAFCACSNLKSVKLPAGLIRIGNEAFCATGLTELNLPEGLQQVGTEAFAGCSNLVSANSPSTLLTVGHSMFMDCFRLQTVTFAEGPTKILDSAFYNCAMLDNIVLPNTMRIIGPSAFSYTGISSIILPE